MRGVKLCSSRAGDLIGLQAYVAKFSTTDNSLISTYGMNKVGSVSGESCSTLLVDPTKGEYFKKFAMRYGANQVEAVSLTTS
jgi:hypothetical protein